MEIDEPNPGEKNEEKYDADKVANYFKNPKDIFGEVTKKGEKEEDKKDEPKKLIPRPL